MVRKYSKKALDKRKEERECLTEFFIKHVEIAKGRKCEECGARLIGDSSEVAHVLPKQLFKSVMCDDVNVLYMCGKFSEKQCHTNYDNWTDEKIKQMNIYPKIKQVYKQLKEIITEKLNYKITDRFE